MLSLLLNKFRFCWSSPIMPKPAKPLLGVITNNSRGATHTKHPNTCFTFHCCKLQNGNSIVDHLGRKLLITPFCIDAGFLVGDPAATKRVSGGRKECGGTRRAFFSGFGVFNISSGVCPEASGVFIFSLGVCPAMLGACNICLGVCPATFGVFNFCLGVYNISSGVFSIYFGVFSILVGACPEAFGVCNISLGVCPAEFRQYFLTFN